MSSGKEQIQGLSEVARKIKEEDSSAFKIALVEDGYTAGLLNKLLTRGMRVSKNRITELGYMASDLQNLANLAKERDIVIAPFDIVANRLSTFCPPAEVTEIVLLSVTSDNVRVDRYRNEGKPFELSIHF